MISVELRHGEKKAELLPVRPQSPAVQRGNSVRLSDAIILLVML